MQYDVSRPPTARASELLPVKVGREGQSIGFPKLKLLLKDGWVNFIDANCSDMPADIKHVDDATGMELGDELMEIVIVIWGDDFTDELQVFHQQYFLSCLVPASASGLDC